VLHKDITLVFKNGKVVSATSSEQDVLTGILNIDDGARHVGEFALGVNPFITVPLGDTIFDEKILGSFHIALGRCYDEAPNGNVSAIHWDLVSFQTGKYGGGEIYFDDTLIRKDGVFSTDDLKELNANK